MNAHKILACTSILTAINTLICLAGNDRWPNIDVRVQTISPEVRARHDAATLGIKLRIPGLRVDFHPILESPDCVYSMNRLLSDPEAISDGIKTPPLPHGATPLPTQPVPDKSDRYRLLKKFLNENSELFGYDANILSTARITRESVTDRRGLRTVIWQQEFDGVPIFEGVLVANFTSKDALVSFSSQVVPDLSHATRANTALISAVNALTLAARNIGEEQSVAAHFSATGVSVGLARTQTFEGEPIIGDAKTSLVWLPMDRTTLRMCWSVVLTGRTSGKIFQVLVDAASGEIIVRHCWSRNAVEGTYLVFDKDSAAPLLPGWSTPITNQAPVTTQVNLTLTELFPNASPAGWVNTNAIFGLINTTFGNNVDARLDWTNAFPAYAYGSTNILVPRPMGGLTNGRVEFTGASFTTDFNQHPTNAPNRDAAVINAFYWCNWMHDVLYELGFTEAAGNFQNDNFGRGGLSGDAILMDVQAGATIGSAGAGGSSLSPQDGGPGRIIIGVFRDSARDGAFDNAIILHEYTHHVVSRLVGGGIGINTALVQAPALDEGWADFYALALLSEASDDIGGTFQFGAFSSFRYLGLAFDENNYFGFRAYPYSTDLLKNPMTLKDLALPPNIDPYPGIPLSPLYVPFSPTVRFFMDEAHARGQVWCGALWDARANLIQTLGFGDGNKWMLELTMDAMKLGPANPTFLQARDFVLLANLYTNAANHHLELWTAFAKRGMGYTAVVTEVTNDFGDPPIVAESFSIPPFVEISNSTYASPAIAADGTVYIGSSNGWFYAVANDGTNRFMLSDPTNTFQFPGKVKWSFGGLTTNHAFNSSPALSPTGVIYAGCNDSNLYAIASSGAMIWRTDLGGEIVSSPSLANDGTIYVGSGDGKLCAVNPDGTVKWSTSFTGSNILCSPAVSLNGIIYIGSMHPSTNLYAVNPTNGAILTGWPVTVTNGVYSSPAVDSDGSIYVGGLDGKVHAFTTNGSPKSGWPVTTGGPIWSSPSVGSNGVVYIGSTDSNLYAINPNGTTNWTYKTRGAVRSSPALGRDGTVFVGSDDFNLHVINADGTARWQYPIGEPVVSSPVIGPDGGLFVGSTAGNLYYLPTGTQFADGPWSMFRQNFRHSANANTVILRRPQVSGGGLNIEVAGPVGAQCDIEITTSFTPPNWSALTTVTLANGVGSFQVSPTNAQSFFRAVTD